MLKRGDFQVVVVKGCRVNLRGEPEGALVRNGWKLATTCFRLAEAMNLPCRCETNYKHGELRHQQPSQRATLTIEFCKKAAKVITQELSTSQVQEELRGQSQLVEGFGEGD